MSKALKKVPTSGLGRFNQIKPFTNVLFSLLFIILALLTVLPVIFVFIISISSEASIAANGYSFFPSELSLGAYEYLWNSKDYIGRAFLNSIGITIVGCYLPFLLKRDNNHLHTLIAFSGGVMLGVLFIMLMPEALHETIEAGFEFDTACYMIMAGFVLLFVIDFLVKKYLGFDEHGEDEHAHSITSLSAFSQKQR